MKIGQLQICDSILFLSARLGIDFGWGYREAARAAIRAAGALISDVEASTPPCCGPDDGVPFIAVRIVFSLGEASCKPARKLMLGLVPPTAGLRPRELLMNLATSIAYFAAHRPHVGDRALLSHVPAAQRARTRRISPTAVGAVENHHGGVGGPCVRGHRRNRGASGGAVAGGRTCGANQGVRYRIGRSFGRGPRALRAAQGARRLRQPQLTLRRGTDKSTCHGSKTWLRPPNELVRSRALALPTAQTRRSLLRHDGKLFVMS